MRLHFSIGCKNRRRTSRCRQGVHFSKIQTFLLIMCIGAPESASHSRSSGFKNDAGRHLFSEGEKNAALFFSRLIFGYFWPTSTLLRGHIALAILYLPQTDPQILEDWGYADEDLLDPSEGFWSRMLAWRTTAFVSRTYRIGFCMFELFRNIDEDFGGSIFWNTQPNCRVIFNIATALLSPFFFDLLLGCSST